MVLHAWQCRKMCRMATCKDRRLDFNQAPRLVFKLVFSLAPELLLTLVLVFNWVCNLAFRLRTSKVFHSNLVSHLHSSHILLKAALMSHSNRYECSSRCWRMPNGWRKVRFLTLPLETGRVPKRPSRKERTRQKGKGEVMEVREDRKPETRPKRRGELRKDRRDRQIDLLIQEVWPVAETAAIQAKAARVIQTQAR